MSRAGLLLALALLAPAGDVLAEQTSEMTAAYRAQTGQRSLDAWLADLNHYVERHPEAFLDVLHHGTGIARNQLQRWLQAPGRQAADLYLACHLAVLLEQPCPRLLAVLDAAAGLGWEAALQAAGEAVDGGPAALTVTPAHWRSVRENLTRDYRHFARPQPGQSRPR